MDGWALCLAIFRKEQEMKIFMKRLTPALIILLSAGSLFFAVWSLLDIEKKYQKGKETYRQIEKEYIKEPKEDPKGPQEDNPEARLTIDFEGLKAANPDIIGWIEVPGAGISYPLVQGNDNSYYLTHMSSGKYGIHGSIFMDCHNAPDFSGSNTIIYGHNMKDGTMFAALSEYQSPALYQQYPYFYIYLPDGVLKYQIFSCYCGQIGSMGYTYAFPQKAAFQDFLDALQSYASYGTDIQAGITDHIVTLSTCVNTDRDYRYLIHGKLICRKKEKEND